MAVVVFGLLSAVTWGTGDFGGGMLSRRAPLLSVVAVTQAVGVLAALVIALVRGEPPPRGADIGWAIGAGLCGMGGIAMLYRGLAVGRMGVVAPTTGIIGAVIPIVVGFAFQGMPPVIVIIGILVALLSVVLVTRAPGHQAGQASGIEWALGAGIAIGGFNLCIAGFSGETAFGPLVILRMLQSVAWIVVIIAWRQPWRFDRALLPKMFAIGILDMVGNAAFILAAGTGNLAVAAVLSSLYPVMTVLLAIAVLRERMTRSHTLGIALTVIAIVMITIGSAGR
ncbi:MAG: DMT family transporter [Chloroflexota bacterium]